MKFALLAVRSGHGFSKALAVSLALHFVLALFIFSLGNSLVRTHRIFVVDLSRLDSSNNQGTASRASISDVHLRAGNMKQHRKAMMEEPLPPKPVSEIDKPPPTIPPVAALPPADARLEPVETIPSRINNGSSGANSQRSPDIGSTRPSGSGVISGGLSTGSGGGHSLDPDKAGNIYLKEHFAYIRDIIQRYATYPFWARKMGWQGKVVLSFVVASNGYVRDIRILHGSGREILDRSAVKAVTEAAPFPKPPVEAKLIIPVLYKIY